MKKPYVTPAIRVHGDIRAVTRANGALSLLDQEVFANDAFDPAAFS